MQIEGRSGVNRGNELCESRERIAIQGNEYFVIILK